MRTLNINDKVSIIYNASHGKSNDAYSSAEVKTCLRKYKVSYHDPRATKKNLQKFVAAKDNGYRKDFNDYCFGNNLADGRKTRNGKKEWNNSLKEQVIVLCFLAFFNWMALEAYGMKILLPLVLGGEYAIWKLLGRRKGIIGAIVFFIVFCQIAYRFR